MYAAKGLRHDNDGPSAMRAVGEKDKSDEKKRPKPGAASGAAASGKAAAKAVAAAAGKDKGKADKMPKIIKPPKSECEDLLGAKACGALKPMCHMFKLRAYYACRKTCKLCEEDKPEPASTTDRACNIIRCSITFLTVLFLAEIEADLPELKGKVTISQCAPRTTVYMSVCVAKDNKIIKPDKEYGLEIHEYATIEKGGTKCKDVGPEFNPYNVR